MYPFHIDEIKTITCSTDCDQRITKYLQHGWRLLHVEYLPDQKEFLLGREQHQQWNLDIHTLDQSHR